MIVEYERKSRLPLWGGFLGMIVGRVLAVVGASNEQMALVGLGVVLSLGCAVLFIYGCMQYCKGKGYPAALGLLGLLSIIGLIILAVLPDKHKGGMQQGMASAPPPPPYASPTVAPTPADSEQQTPQA